MRYYRIDTQADPSSPSSEQKYDLLRLLVDELSVLGAAEVRLTEYDAILATIPAIVDADLPAVAFLAHVDTALGFNASGVKPVIHRSYDGGAMTFPDDASLVLSPEESPYLATKVGDDIVTASGTTLLGPTIRPA